MPVYPGALKWRCYDSYGRRIAKGGRHDMQDRSRSSSISGQTENASTRPNVLEHFLENRKTVECISQFAMLLRVRNRQSPQALVDGLLSHANAHWQLAPVELHYCGSISVEPIPAILAHRRSLRAQALPRLGICIWRTSK